MRDLHIILRPTAQDPNAPERQSNPPHASAGRAILSLSHQADMTLLETLEFHRQPVESQCRAGFCGACRTRLYQGEVRYLTTPLAFIGEDEILPCCCVPHTDLHIGLYADSDITGIEIQSSNSKPAKSNDPARDVTTSTEIPTESSCVEI